MSYVLVISPSGNFYGSEQVLFDYLDQSKRNIDVLVPRDSLFLRKLRESDIRTKLKTYDLKRLPRFYSWVFFQLLRGKYDIVYLNEAGHIRYIALLANIFGHVKFIVHVRLLEDTNAFRWKYAKRKNILVLAISRYLGSKLPVSNQLLYDCYQFIDRILETKDKSLPAMRVAIIGRITRTKGIGRLPEIVDHIESVHASGRYQFYLFGEISHDMEGDPLIDKLKTFKNVLFKGFQEDQESMYRSIDCVLHLSTEEGLGRIYFESIDRYIPFVGFKSGGVAEIGELTELDKFLVEPSNGNMASGVLEKLELVRTNYDQTVTLIADKKKTAWKLFGIKRYNSLLDTLLS